MFETFLGPIIVFGVLFAICMIGLFGSNSASERLHARGRNDYPDDMRAGSGRVATGLR